VWNQEKSLKFVEKVKKTIKKFHMLESGDRVIVGVSGGPDSIALLHVLQQITKRYKLSLKVAHLNHGFRGKEAQKEAQFVEETAQKLGLSCEVKSFDVPAYKKKSSLSSQEAARVIRYQFLKEVKENCSAEKIALGHNANDQAETMMMWLLRGTGVKGLSGIPPVREGVIIRPLIETTREEIETYLKEEGIPFVIDSSNQKNDYLRNRLRNELFPLLEEHYNPRLIKNLVQTSYNISRENEYIEDIANELLDDITAPGTDGSLVIDSKKLLALSPVIQLRCVRGVLEQVKGDLRRIGSIHIYAILKIASSDSPHKVLKLPGGIRVEKSYHHLTVKYHQTDQPSFNYRLTSIPGRMRIEEIEKEMHFKMLEGGDNCINKENHDIAYLDGGKALLPLTIRNVRPGDRFQPLGMKGEKKVKDFFIDEKVPMTERKRVPLLFFGDVLGWIGGMRINHRLRVTKRTKKVLRVEIR
jgi:tRNA(Ile)-lysidine synthase